jgi:hypothetical protein
MRNTAQQMLRMALLLLEATPCGLQILLCA